MLGDRATNVTLCVVVWSCGCGQALSMNRDTVVTLIATAVILFSAAQLMLLVRRLERRPSVF